MEYDVKLELKKTEEDNKVFYRYRFDTCKIWFDQDQITGNIYRVNVVDEQYPDVEYYVDDTEDRFYPMRVRAKFGSCEVTDMEDAKSYLKKITLCNHRRFVIEQFLLTGDNFKIWESRKERNGKN